MKVLIAGDYCDRYRVSGIIRNGNYEDLFNKVRPMIKNADFSIVNFEFPIVANEGCPIKKCGPNLRGQVQSVDAIKYAGFNVCTLANNHILDQGGDCCLDTMKLLNDVGIKTVGAGKNLAEASRILYLKKGNETLAIINCCEHEFSIATDTAPGANPLNPVSQFYKIQEARQNADCVIVIAHGGCEHFQYPTMKMRENYCYFIDCGASVVINHHQHCYSGYELYNGKPIFYGLGNFCFDHKTVREGPWTQGYMVSLDLTSKELSFELLPYTQCCAEATVAPMTELESKSFIDNINSINRIITSSELLSEENLRLSRKQSNIYLNLLEPYNSRLTKALRKKGLLPSFINDHKKYQLINYLSCESHIDRFINVLKEL